MPSPNSEPLGRPTKKRSSPTAARPSVAKAKVAKGSVVPPAGKKPWSQMQKVFDETEVKLAEYERKLASAPDKMEEKSGEKIAEIEHQWMHALDWAQEKIVNLRSLESKAEGIVGEARVKAHLARMEAEDVVGEIKLYVDRFRRRLDGLMSTSSAQSAEALQRLSDGCLKLKSMIEH